MAKSVSGPYSRPHAEKSPDHFLICKMGIIVDNFKISINKLILKYLQHREHAIRMCVK